MGGKSRVDRASDQDAHRQCAKPRLRLPGLALLRREEVAPPEEPPETAGQAAAAEAAYQRAKPRRGSRQGQSDTAGLVWLLLRQLSHGPERPGWLAAASPAGDAAQ